MLLSALDADRLDELYPDSVLPSATARSLATKDALCAELGAVRARGYARNLGESESDMYALAVPVRRPDGGTVAALSIAAPLSRLVASQDPAALSPEEARFLAALQDARRAIEVRLAF